MTRRFCLFAACAAAVAFNAFGATCTYTDGAWDTPPSGEADDIVIVSGDLTWGAALPHKVASWTQGEDYTGTVMFETTYGDAFPLFEVTGDVVLNGGTWKHKANSGSSFTWRLNVKIGGGLTIGENAVINANGCGRTSWVSVDGVATLSGTGSTYGGHGGTYSKSNAYFPPSGSLFEPEDLGMGGSSQGGGAIRLEVLGAVLHNGKIVCNANGPAYYSGTGGSVYIIADSISGTGTISAAGGDISGRHSGGGGGRIAIKLTGAEADFSNYDIVNLTTTLPAYMNNGPNGVGTVYAETAADEPHQGWLIFKGDGNSRESWGYAHYADPFAYDVAELKFAKITLTNNVMMLVYTGKTLDISDTVIESSDATASAVNGIAVLGSLVTKSGAGSCQKINCRIDAYGDLGSEAEKLEFAGGSSFKVIDGKTVTCVGDVQMDSGSKLIIDGELVVDGNLTMAGGATGSHTGPATEPTAHFNLSVTGNLTMEETSEISVKGCGYAANKKPTTETGEGATHGGRGLDGYGNFYSLLPYGSVKDPVTCGAGRSGAGGGAVKIVVGGVFTANGTINANGGGDGTYYGGAGGSVNVTAGSLAGAGTIMADGQNPSYGNIGPAGGGRIAVKLTGAQAGFDDFTGEIHAYGGRPGNHGFGGAGTVFKKRGDQTMDQGALIVNNYGVDRTVTKAGTYLGDRVTDCTSFGDVIVRGGAKLILADGMTVYVSGCISNVSDLVCGSGSTIEFVGSTPSTIFGNQTFANLVCKTPGKQVLVAAGSTQTVTGTLNFDGAADNKIVLKGIDDSSWTLQNGDASISMSGVSVGGCQSQAAMTVMNGDDLNGNSDNITFKNITPGETITWTGAVDSRWGAEGNWDLQRVPISTDRVVIPSGAKSMPKIGVGVSLLDLTVAEGASFDIGGNAVEVAGETVINGELVCAGSASLTLRGNVQIGGVVRPAQSVVILAGVEAQVVSVGADAAFNVIRIENTDVTVSGTLKGAELQIGDATKAYDVKFAKGTTVDVTKLVVPGSESAANVTLQPETSGDDWSLVVCETSVTGVKVANCDASKGVLVVPVKSTDLGGNVNWLFNDTRLHWNGTDPIGPGDDVVLDKGVAATLTEVTSVKSLALDPGSSLVMKAQLAVFGSVTIGDGSTLTLNKPSTVGGNLVVLKGGTITHDAPTEAEMNCIDLTVAGSGYLAAGATIMADGKAGSSSRGKRGYLDGSAGGSYGGRGYTGYKTVGGACYGSIVDPRDVGSRGGQDAFAGGCVILSFGKGFTLDGTISADGNPTSYYSPSGGSVNITAAQLTGSGSFHANGAGNQFCGAGGRLAVRLTAHGSKFSDFQGTYQMRGGLSGQNEMGSSGTLFISTADDPDGHGLLRIFKQELVTIQENDERTDFPKTATNNPREVDNVFVDIGNNAVLNLTSDAVVSDLTMGAAAKVRLNGYRLHILARKHALGASKDKDWRTNAQILHDDGGEIVWGKGLMLIIR